MPTITEKTVKDGKVCGFCSTGGRHDLCPEGVLNGDGMTVIRCTCPDHDHQYRCLGCGVKSPTEISPETWTCLDPESCTTRREARREKTFRDLYGGREGEEGTRALPRREKAPKAPSKPKTGKCLCCGETTGGGLFRPGHDSKYLTGAVESVKGGKYTVDEALQLMTDQGISEALRAKFVKRVA